MKAEGLLLIVHNSVVLGSRAVGHGGIPLRDWHETRTNNQAEPLLLSSLTNIGAPSTGQFYGCWCSR